MTNPQLKIMEQADKTLSFGCIVKSKNYWIVTLTELFDCACDNILSYSIWEKLPHVEPIYLRYKLYSGNVWLDDVEEAIGRPYWFERLIYLYEINYMKTSNLIAEIGTITNYLSTHPQLYLKPCIDRPEDWQKLVIDFLETLPKSD